MTWRDAHTASVLCFCHASYASSQAHSSVKKAAMIAGLPMANFRTIKASKSNGFAMDPAELESQIEDDLEAGLLPAVCVATLGTTGIAAVDPLGPIGRVRVSLYSL